MIFISSLAFAGDPIPGADMKVGCKPPSSCKHKSSVKTDANGEFEIKNLTAGNYSYYLEFGYKQTSLKGSATAYVQIENINLLKCTASKTKAAPAPIVDRFNINTVEYGQVNLTITYDCNSIKGKLEKADPNQRGSVVTSRSNIKR